MSAARRLAAGLLAAALLLAACAPRPAARQPTSTAGAQVVADPVTPAGTSTAPVSTATATPEPTATAVSTPTPTPAPIVRQLTTGGCCAQPFWSADGTQVRYIDRPSGVSPSGIWGVGLEGGEPVFVTDRLGLYSPDGTLLAYPRGGQTYIERLGGEAWVIANGGRPVRFSPDSTRIAWQASSSTVNFDRRQVTVWVANVDGSEARAVAQLVGGGVSDWFPDGQRLLVSGHEAADSEQEFIAALNVADGSLTPIVTTTNLRGAVLSPGGGWLVYQIAFSGDPNRDGLWVTATDGSGARRLDVFGAYRWRAEGELALVPMEPGAPSHRVLAVSAATGEVRPLTDPAVTPLRIAGGDWAISPDGAWMVYVSADDRNLWLVELRE